MCVRDDGGRGGNEDIEGGEGERFWRIDGGWGGWMSGERVLRGFGSGCR